MRRIARTIIVSLTVAAAVLAPSVAQAADSWTKK